MRLTVRFCGRFWTAVFLLAAATPLGGLAAEMQASPFTREVGDAAALVSQLGDSRFVVRERAAESLIQIGLPAIAALEQGITNPDREVRYRSQRALRIIRQQDFLRRLDAFSRSSDSQQDYDLPAWQWFRSLVGDDGDARVLFVEMQRAEPELLAAFAASQATDSAADQAQLAELVDLRVQQIQSSLSQFPDPATSGSIATLLFVGSDEKVNLSDLANDALTEFCYQDGFTRLIEIESKGKVLKKVLGAAIQNAEGFTTYRWLALAIRHDLPEGLAPAERELKRSGSPPHVILYALLTFGRLGNETHIAMLEPFLDDHTPYTTRPMKDDKSQVQVQFCDIALAAMVHLAKQNPKDFGLTAPPSDEFLFTVEYLGFESDELRNAAIAKWRAFRQKS